MRVHSLGTYLISPSGQSQLGQADQPIRDKFCRFLPNLSYIYCILWGCSAQKCKWMCKKLHSGREYRDTVPKTEFYCSYELCTCPTVHDIITHSVNSFQKQTLRRWDLAEWLERLAVNDKVATVLLPAFPASSDTVESDGRQMKQWITYRVRTINKDNLYGNIQNNKRNS